MHLPTHFRDKVYGKSSHGNEKTLREKMFPLGRFARSSRAGRRARLTFPGRRKVSGVPPSGHVVVTFEQQQQRCTSELAHCLFVATSCSSRQVGCDGPLARSVVRSAPEHFLPPAEFCLALLWSTTSREKPMARASTARASTARGRYTRTPDETQDGAAVEYALS